MSGQGGTDGASAPVASFATGGGGGGGGGGFGLVLSGTGLASNAGSIDGGQGGQGGRSGANPPSSPGSFFGGGGGGGAGGGGLLLKGGAYFTNTGSVSGGAGGNAGQMANFSVSSLNAFGGAGGMGVALTGPGTIDNRGAITGGKGGLNGTLYVGIVCVCSSGGAGIVLTAGGTVLNTGTIVGGAGGANAPGSDPSPGGIGIQALGNAGITNAGHIGGGLGGDGLTRANAIALSGGGNTLTLHAGYSFAGNVVSTSGTAGGGDRFALGGDTNPAAAFDVSSLVGSLPGSYTGTQFVGFTNFAKTGSSTWSLTGTGGAGQHWTITDGALRGAASAFGGNIAFAPASPTSTPGVVFDQAADESFGNTISGAGRVTKSGSGTLTLTAGNAHTGGTQIDGGVLSITDDAQLGATAGALDFNGGTLAVQATGFAVTTNRTTTLGAAGGTIDVAPGASLEHAGVISGPGGLTKNGTGDMTLLGVNTYQGGTTINSGILGGTTASFGSGDVVVDAGLLLLFSANASNVFANDVHGAGALASRGLSGVVLTGQNTYRGGTSIYGGSLTVSSDANLGDAAGALSFVGQFNDSVLKTTADLTMQRATHLTRQGTFDVLAGTTLTHQGVIDGGARLVKDGAGRLVLTGTNTYGGGTTIAAGTLVGGAGSFGSGAITNNATLVIDQASDATLANAIDGTGGLTKTGAGVLTLTGNNSHSGGTTLGAGVLSIASEANLGHLSSALRFDGGLLRVTGTGFTATSRSIEWGQNGGGFDIADAAASFTVSQALSGSGVLTKAGDGALTLTGANTHSGGTLIEGGTLIGSVGSLGTGPILNNAGLHIDQASDASLDVVVSGSGQITKTGIGTLTLTGSNTHSGGTLISAGTLRGGAASFGSGAITNNAALVIDQASDGTLANDIDGDGGLGKTGAGALTLTGLNSYRGATLVSEGSLRAGATHGFSAASAHSLAAGTTLDLAGFSQTVAGLSNINGTVSLVGAAPGTTLTITGAYVGNDGLLRLGAVLGDSSSASDRLVLDGAGASASGRTTIELINLGGLGAQTTGDGIEVIAARNGATTTAQTTRDAFALQGGHVDAGAYEYRLYAGDANGAGESWFLRSDVIRFPAYRAEVPLFAALPAQLREGNLAMLGSLSQRRGDEPQRGSGGDASFGLRQLALAPAQAAIGANEREAWARVLGSRLRIRQNGTVSPSSRGRLSGLQVGTDLWADEQWRVGLYMGQLDTDFDVQGFAQGVAGAPVGGSATRSRYLGAYANWTRSDGFYVDAVLQSGQHRYSVQPLTNPNARAEADSLSTSIEVGRSLPLQEGWQVEPQLQLVHQRMRFDDVTIPGATVHQQRQGSWLGRVGVRIHGDLQTGAGRLRPYANFNLYRATGGQDSTLFSNPFATTTISSRSGGSAAELAAGFALDLNRHTSVHAGLGQLWSLGGDQGVQSQWQASLGLRVRW